MDGVCVCRLDVYNLKEDTAVFTGKRALISFLSWLDYCDQLIKEAQKVLNTDHTLCRVSRRKGASLCDRLMCSAEKGDWRFGMEGRKQDRVTRKKSL